MNSISTLGEIEQYKIFKTPETLIVEAKNGDKYSGFFPHSNSDITEISKFKIDFVYRSKTIENQIKQVFLKSKKDKKRVGWLFPMSVTFLRLQSRNENFM